MSATFIDAAGLVAVAAVFGGMLFFAFVYAPLVFIKLGTETGGRFIREVFPVYYAAMGATSVAAAVLLGFASAERGADVLAMACIGIVFFLARFVLLPVINRNRDAGQAGDVAAKRRFDALHRASVIVNLVQMVAVLARISHQVAKRGRGDGCFRKANASQGAQAYLPVRRAPWPRSTRRKQSDPRPQP